MTAMSTHMNRRTRLLSRFRRSRLLRCATQVAIAGHMMAATPVLGQDLAQATVKASIQAGKDVVDTAKTGTNRAARKATRLVSDARRRVAKATVRVNRAVPKVSAPNIDPMFGLNVTTEALVRARFFPEQLIPTSTPTPDENAAVARTLERIAVTPADRWGAILDAHIQDHPTSPWRASLVATAGTLYAREGYFSRAASYWTQAWEMTRDSHDRKVKVLADYALGESIAQMAKFGQVERLEARLKETTGREFRGTPGTKVEDGWEALRMLREKHHMALFSGPEALKIYLTVRPVENLETAVRTIAAYHPSFEGTSMTELKTLGASVGLHLSMWRASSIEEFPVPSIVHLRSQHFSAIVETKDGKYRLRDPGLGGDIWITAEALRDETTGYVLGASRPDGDEWRPVSDGEGQAAIGHCQAGKPSSDDPPCPNCGGGGPGRRGMPSYSFHPTGVGLVIEDEPLSYAPAVGPDMSFWVAYNHRDYKTPNTFGYGNVGPLWTFNSLSYVMDNTTMVLPPYTVTGVYLRGHGYERYSSYDPVHNITGAELVEVSHDPARYERRLRDGSVEVFTLADRAASLPARQIFLTEAIDPQGHTVSYTYDSSFRLVGVTDALGQVTTFAYEHGTDANLLTKVTDPFGRFATLGYDGQGRLNSITDAAGMTSTFTYGNSDFIVAMTTPYGTTTFRHEPSSSTTAVFRAIEATDPVGGRERLEFHLENPAFADTAPSGEVPTGFSASNGGLSYYNSFYWDKLAMAQHPGDYSYAVNTNWMLAMDISYGHPQSRPIPHSIKRPLENRVWYRYPGQGPTNSHSLPGVTQPALVGRVLDDGASQVTTMTYNSKWMVTSRIDPLGRQTNYTYASNGLDLLTVEQVRSGGTDVIQQYSNYSNHLPGTITDAAGQDTDIAYNSAGQPLTVTNAKNETTTYTYETGTNNLLTVTGPVSGATTTYTYDAYNRVESVEDADGYVVISDYDNLNRLTQRIYPDDTTETFTYSRLDLTEQKDRLRRITRHFYDGFGRRIATRDPAGRTIAQQWCDCGSLEALVDANGNRTRWERDVRGRVTREIRADNTTETLYTYDLAGRLKTVTDPKDQLTTHSYNVDDSLSGTAYTNEEIETPNVSYTYDTYYARVATMVDGIGTTSYTYKPAGTNGAGQVASIDGPLSNDTIAYTYDELGRVIQRTLNGSANQVDWTFDALGRVTSEENLLGEFTYSYDGVTNRLATLTYPNDQTSTYSYFDDENDHRLQTIHHKYPNASTLSKFDYTYDAVGNILTWRQQADSTAVLWKFTYDQADQLMSAVKHATDTPQTVLQRFAYAYDPAGNRTVEQIDDAITWSAYDNLNRLTSQAPGGPMTIAGTLNEPGTVTISGKPAVIDASNNFRGTVPTTTGTNTFTIVAKDATGNTTTQQYEVDLSGSSKTFTYDANGNLTSDGTSTFEWDARNQLVAVNVGTHRSEFSYDGKQRRVRVVEKDGGVNQSDTPVLWCDKEICEERAADGVTVTRRSFALGEQVTGTARFFTADHLGSIGEVTDSANTLLARYAFDPWGRRTVAAGTDVTPVGFTGHRWHASGEVWLTQYRQLDSGMGRWTREDPLGFEDGVNLYSYVHNSPVNYVDPSGLQAATATWPWVGKLCVDAAKAASGVLGAAMGVIVTQCGDGCVEKNNGCPPCNPPVGTVGYRLDVVPPSKPHFPHKGSHVHLYIMRQSPKTCECKWNKWMVTEPPPPPGAVPMPGGN
jgi:RHS repeat-associated protein